MITVRVDSAAVQAGGFVTGEVRWTAEDDRRPHLIVATAEWVAAGGGNEILGVARAQQIPVNGRRELTMPLRMRIPHEGPLSFKGIVMSISWKINVRVHVSGFDEFADVEFRVAPRPARPSTS